MTGTALPWKMRLGLMLPALALVGVLLGGALILLLDLSLHYAAPGRLSPEPGYTLKSHIRAVTDVFYLTILWRTLWVSLLVTAICAVLGFPLALFLWRAPARWKSTLVLLVIAPLLISLVVRAYGWMVLLGDTGLINRILVGLGLIETPLHLLFGLPAVIVGLVHVQMPFMVLSLLTAMERIDPVLLRAAESLSASRLRVVAEIILPLSLTGLTGGATLVFTLCMTAFVTPQLLGGSGSQVMTTLIYGQFMSAFNWPLGAALATLLAVTSVAGVICVGLLGLMHRVLPGRLRFAAKGDL